MPIRIGIDPSITSTGVCIWDTEHNINKYYNIVKNPTKKQQNFKSDHINILAYESPVTKDMSSVEKEFWKASDIKRIINHLELIFDLFNPDIVLMESIAMSANGRIELLAGLNYAIRLLAMNYGIPFYCLTPQMIKKEFVGNGNASKQEMMSGWKACDVNSLDYKDFAKNAEDLADAYAICHYPGF